MHEALEVVEDGAAALPLLPPLTKQSGCSRIEESPLVAVVVLLLLLLLLPLPLLTTPPLPLLL